MNIKIPGPKQFFDKINSGVSRQVKAAFVSALIIGFLTHTYGFIHLMPNHDGVYTSLIHTEDMLYQGRWFQKYVSLLTSPYSMPWVNGCFSVLALAFSAALIVWLFKINKTYSAVIVSALIVTFPTVTSSFGYLYMADAFTFALLLSVLAVCVSRKFPKFGFIVSAALICLSLGIYQSYICVSFALFAVMPIFDVLDKEKSNRQIIIQGIKDIASLGAGMILYLAVLKMLLNITGTQLTDYQNIDQLNSGVKVLNFLPGIKAAYAGFFDYFSQTLSGLYNPAAAVFHVAAVASSGVLMIFLYLKKKIYKNILASVIFWGLTLVLPAVFYSVAFISPDVIHSLMIFSVCVAYIMPVKLLEEVFESIERQNAKNILVWAGIAVFAVIVGSNYFLANKAYLTLQAKYNQTYAYAEKLSARIESCEEYRENIPVAVAGYTKTFDYTSSQLAGFKFKGKYLINVPQRYYNFFRDYIGADYTRVPDEELDRLMNTEEFGEMPVYPAAGSIKEIDGVLVVKLGE